MSHKVTIVTGANKGIGFAIVRALCKQWDGQGHVYLTARNETRGLEAVKKLNSEGLKPQFHQLDIEDVESINALSAYMKATYGGVDILINNAGFAYKNTATEPFHVQAEDTIKINYTGTLNMVQSFMPLMKNNGRMVNVSSMSSIFSLGKCSKDVQCQFKDPNMTLDGLSTLLNKFIDAAKTTESAVEAGFSNSAYGMSKVGVTVLTRILSKQLNKDAQKGVLLNCCCPGWIKTDMAGDKPTKTPDQGAENPVYLALLPEGTTAPQGEYLSEKTVKQWY